MGQTLGTLRLIDDPLILYRIEYATIALGMPLIVLYVIKLIERETSNDKIAYALFGIGSILMLMLRDSRCLLNHEYPQPLPTIHRRDGTLPDTASLVRDTRGEPDSKVVRMGLWCTRIHNCPRYSLHPRGHC